MPDSWCDRRSSCQAGASAAQPRGLAWQLLLSSARCRMVGETLGNYRIVAELGSGGMGVVYAAEHIILGKRAAIKVLRPSAARAQKLSNASSMRPKRHRWSTTRASWSLRLRSPVRRQRLHRHGAAGGKNPHRPGRGRGTPGPGRAISLARHMAGTLKATHEARDHSPRPQARQHLRGQRPGHAPG